jgi:hypothetical protein
VISSAHGFAGICQRPHPCADNPAALFPFSRTIPAAGLSLVGLHVVFCMDAVVTCRPGLFS